MCSRGLPGGGSGPAYATLGFWWTHGFSARGLRVVPRRVPGPGAVPPQDVVNTHPGLAFLKEAAEFHSRYITTVSAAPAAPAPRSHQAHVSVGLFSGAREG